MKKIFRNIDLLEKKDKIQVVSGNPRSRALDTPAPANVDRPVKSHNFAKILKGQKGAGKPQFKSILKVAF